MNIKRKLASVQVIESIKDIPGKDKIGLARINGWNVIINKDKISAGDKVVFFEQDSLLPDLPPFEFMKKNNFRVQKTKMAGVISEGLAMPLSDLFLSPYFYHKSNDDRGGIDESKFEIGEDLTDELRVKHFEDRIHESKKFNKDSDCLTTFPNSVPRTDAIRIQNFQELLNMNSKYFLERYAVTEKLDGTSMTVIAGTPNEIGLRIDNNNAQVFVCSRNFVKKEKKDCDYWQMVKQLKLDERMLRYYKETGLPIAIQGEIIGPGIQSNKYKLKERKFMVFSIFDIKTGLYSDLWNTCMPHLSEREYIKQYFDNLEFVPFVGHVQVYSYRFNEFKPEGEDVEGYGNETADELARQKLEDCREFRSEVWTWANKKCNKSNLNPDIVPEGVVLSNAAGNMIKYIY